MHKIVMTQRIRLLFSSAILMIFLLVRGLADSWAFKISVPRILVVGAITAGLFRLLDTKRFARHRGFQRCLQLSSRTFQGVLEIHVIRVNVLNALRRRALLRFGFSTARCRFSLCRKLFDIADHTSGHQKIGPGCCLHSCQSLQGPRVSFLRLLFQSRDTGATAPWPRQVSVKINIPTIIYLTFQQYIQEW